MAGNFKLYFHFLSNCCDTYYEKLIWRKGWCYFLINWWGYALKTKITRNSIASHVIILTWLKKKKKKKKKFCSFFKSVDKMYKWSVYNKNAELRWVGFGFSLMHAVVHIHIYHIIPRFLEERCSTFWEFRVIILCPFTVFYLYFLISRIVIVQNLIFFFRIFV